jgi:hypothetical protein
MSSILRSIVSKSLRLRAHRLGRGCTGEDEEDSGDQSGHWGFASADRHVDAS